MKQLLIFLSVLTIFNCLAQKRNQSPKSDDFSGVTIEQEGKRINITESITELTLLRSSFSLEFEVFSYNSETEKWYAVKVAATSDKDNLKYFQEGVIGDENPYFSGGTGMATNPNEPYSSMVIRDNGNHYIYYENDSLKRADVILKRENGKVRLKWTINNFTLDDNEIEIAKSQLKELYIMIFIDNNLNEIIEKGEYNLLKVTFK